MSPAIEFAIFRHRGYRDASNGIPKARNPAITVRQERAWLEGWNWFFVADRPSRLRRKLKRRNAA